MRFATSLTLLTVLGVAAGTAWGQALDEEGKPKPTTDPAVAPTNVETKAPGLEYGVDLRLREVFIPKGLLGLFVESVPGGSSNTGFGVDLVRRRGDLELQLGFEYEHLEPAEGVWINSGDHVENGDTVDYILNPTHAQSSFGWFTVEFTFLNHAPINKYVAVRYGGGAGIGFLTGGVYRWDVQCAPGTTNSNPVPGCVPGDQVGGGTGHTADDDTGAPQTKPVKYDFPPVFPVVNAIIGLQIKPTPKAVVNIEGGIRTIPFIGLSAGYFFN